MPPFIFDVLAQPIGRGNETGILSLVFQASSTVQLVLLLLIGLSVASWGVIFMKSRAFRRAALESSDIRHEMRNGGSLADLRDMVEPYADAPEASLLRAGFDEWTRIGGSGGSPAAAQRVRRAIDREATREVIRLESNLTLLATTGSASPFIGLFGTVWGIMNTFRALGWSGSTSLNVVAPGIAEALVATALGLAAAIPAVMAYNHYLRRIRVVEADMETFTSEFLDRLLGAA